MPSLANTLLRWYWTVRVLMNSRAPIPGFDRPSRASLAICASWAVEIQDDDPARAIASFARQHQVTQIAIGSSRRSWWQHLAGHGSNVRRVLREAGAVGIDVHVIARQELPAAASSDSSAPTEP